MSDKYNKTYLKLKSLLPRLGYDDLQLSSFTKRRKNAVDEYIGISNSNPILDTSIYVVEF